MKTPIKIIVVSDLRGSAGVEGAFPVAPGKTDALLEQLQPKLSLSPDKTVEIRSMEDFSLSRLKETLNLKESSADEITKLLHNKAFQNAEASWRGIEYLVSRLPEDGVCMEVLDTPFEDVRKQVYDHVMKPEYEGKTEVPATIILLDYDFSHKGETFEVFCDLAKMGEAIKAPVVGQTTVGFFGMKHLLHLPTIQNPLERVMGQEHARYHEFRDTETAFWASLMINRFLLRAPYKEDGYEEPARADKPEQYLWGRGIWILGANIIKSFSTKQHLVGISGLGTGGEQLGLPIRELPITRSEKVQTALEAPLPTDVVESLPYLGLSPLAQLPEEMGGQHQPSMIYLHLSGNMHKIPDPEEKQFGLLTVHTSLAYSLMLGRVSNLGWKYSEQLTSTNPEDACAELKKLLLDDLWHKEEDEIVITPLENALRIEYNPYLVIHTRRFEISVDIPFGK